MAIFNPPKVKIETRWHATEKEIQSAICQYLDLMKIPYSVTDSARFKTKTGRVHYNSATIGWPDLICCLPPTGQFLGLEVKDHKGRVRPEQEEMHQRIRRAGGRVEVVRSVDEVIEIIERHIGKEPWK